MSKRALIIMLAASCLAVSCSRVNTTTKLSADGSFLRTIVFTVGQSSMDQSSQTDPYKVFDIPAEGAGVHVAKSTATGSSGETQYTVTMPVSAGGSTPHPIGLREGSGKLAFTSDASVSKLENGNLVYTETIHSAKSTANDLSDMFGQLRPEIKKDLPARLVQTEKVDAITREIAASLVRALLGPPEPCIVNMAANPDTAFHTISRAIYGQITKTLKEQGLTDEEADNMARSLFKTAKTEVASSSAKGPANESSSSNDSSGMTAMTFTVQFPGKVVSTDGLVDPLTHEVYWSLYPSAAELGDVKLSLVVDPSSSG